MIDEKTYFEHLRLALVAASDVAESELNKIEFDPNDNLENYREVIGFIKVDGRCKLTRFIKEYANKTSLPNCIIYDLDGVELIKWNNNRSYELWFKYSMYLKHEKPIVEKAMNAIYYVLSQIEDNIEIVIRDYC